MNLMNGSKLGTAKSNSMSSSNEKGNIYREEHKMDREKIYIYIQYGTNISLSCSPDLN